MGQKLAAALALAALGGPLSEAGLAAAPKTIVPAPQLKGGQSRWMTATGTYFSDADLEKLHDRFRLEQQVRVVRFAARTDKAGVITFEHDADELPISLCLSGLKIPGAVIKDAADISIEIDTATDEQITVKVSPADKGIAVGVVAMFQPAGVSSVAK